MKDRRYILVRKSELDNIMVDARIKYTNQPLIKYSYNDFTIMAYQSKHKPSAYSKYKGYTATEIREIIDTQSFKDPGIFSDEVFGSIPDTRVPSDRKVR
jgi:hypothetical protein